MLELRYGLGGEHPRTLDEVGRTFNVTRERIRQIENQSLKKLQTPGRGAEAPRSRVDGRGQSAPNPSLTVFRPWKTFGAGANGPDNPRASFARRSC